MSRPGILHGDKECKLCGEKYFSKGASHLMLENKICNDCVMLFYQQIGYKRPNLPIENWVKLRQEAQGNGMEV